MDNKEREKRNAGLEDNHIEHYIKQKKELIDNYLKGLWSGSKYPPVIYDAMEYSVMAGGKRLRPVLTLAAGEIFGAEAEGLLEPACALELIHTYSLIHDDLPAMDNDDFRRNRPTCHRVYGEAMAILAGDGLLTLAFELLGRYSQHHDPVKGAALVTELASAAGVRGMIGGQVLDIGAEGKEVTVEELEEIDNLKTGALLKVAVRMGAVAAGASPEELEHLTRYAAALGLAYQIVDDLLNLYGEAGRMGKNTGTDREKGKATYPLRIGKKEALNRANDLYRAAQQELAFFGDRAKTLQQLSRKLIFRDS